MCPDAANPFDIFISDSAGLEQLTEITKKCINRLLEAIEKVPDYESGAIVENCRNELQSNEILSENMKMKAEMKWYMDEVNRLQEYMQVLSVEKANLTIRLIKKGDYKIENQPSDKSNENVEEMKNERDMYKKLLTEETEKNSRRRFQQEVSMKKLVESRAFKNLIQQAKSLRKKIDDYRARCDKLYKYRDEFQEVLKKECHRIIQKEEEKRGALSNEIKIIQSKLAESEREKNEAIISLESFKTLNNEHKNSKNWHELVEILTKDKENLRVQNRDLKQKNTDLLQRINELEISKYEVTQEPDPQKLHKIIDDLKNKLKSEHSTVENLISEIELTGNAYEKLEEKVKSLTLQLAEQECLYNKLMNEKVKESAWRSVHDQEKKAYEQKIKSLEDLILCHQQVHKELEGQIKSKQDLISAFENKCKDFENKTKLVIENSEESVMRCQEVLEWKKDYVLSLKHSETIVSKISIEKLDLLKNLEEKQKSLLSLEEKLRKEVDLHNLKSADELLNAEVAQYRVISI